MEKDWFVYILRCKDKSLYTGVTNNVDKRVLAHNQSDTGAKYTKGRRPVVLVYQEAVLNRSEAQKREAEIKNLTKKEKLVLIKS